MKLPPKHISEALRIAKMLFPKMTRQHREAYATGTTEAERLNEAAIHRSRLRLAKERERLIAELGPNYICHPSNYVKRVEPGARK